MLSSWVSQVDLDAHSVGLLKYQNNASHVTEDI